jgi:gluconate kinase
MKKGWEIIHEIQGRFCAKVTRSPWATEKTAAKWQLDRERRKCQMLCSTLKYWYRILLTDKNELLKRSYQWHV